MVCSRCGQSGHNIRTCKEPLTPPNNSENLLLAPAPNNNNSETSNNNESIRNDEMVARNLQKAFDNEFFTNISIKNKTDYEIHAYFLSTGVDKNISIKDAIYMGYIEIFKHKNYRLEIDSKILITKSYYGKDIFLSDINPDDILQIIYINTDTKDIFIYDRKNDILKWKTAALKSQFLLKQIIKYGGMECGNDTIISFLDLVQDLPFPKYDECDLEHAGVPSKLTNIT